MSGQGEGPGSRPGPRSRGKKKKNADDVIDSPDGNLAQIEYLLYQSCQGIHFMFNNRDLARVLREPMNDEAFYTTDTMKRVQGLLTDFLACPSLDDKQNFLDNLKGDNFDLLVRAYFQLVENTILAHSTIRH